MASLCLNSSLPFGAPINRRNEVLSLPNRTVSFSNFSPPPPKRGKLTITCVRVANVEIPNDKRIEFALQSIYGIGRTNSRIIINTLGLVNKVTRDLTEEELTNIRKEVLNYMIEGDLRRYVAKRIDRLKKLRCHRGGYIVRPSKKKN